MPLNRKQIITQVPSSISDLVKTTADNGDYVRMFDSTGTPYKITKANLFAGLSSGGGSAPSNTILSFVASGDANGICYWMGAKDGAWTNPHTSGILLVSASSLQAGHVLQIVDRVAGIPIFSYDSPGSWMNIDFKNYKIKPNYYSIRHDNEVGYYLRSWILQGSNNAGGTWVNLDTQVNNLTINSADGWGSFPVLGITTFYRMLRILSTGADSSGTNYFCCGELKF